MERTIHFRRPCVTPRTPSTLSSNEPPSRLLSTHDVPASAPSTGRPKAVRIFRTPQAWSGAGSGCSAFEPRPSWQTNNPKVASVCPERATADVSAVADPNTGVSVYDSFNYHGSRGWLVFGGTSVSSAIIASVFALAGGVTTYSASYPYANSSSLFNITSGSNGTCGNILCNAAPGWNGPTGLGTPDGTGGF